MTLALIKTPKCNYINFKRAISTIFFNDQVFNFSRKMMKKKNNERWVHNGRRSLTRILGMDVSLDYSDSLCPEL